MAFIYVSFWMQIVTLYVCMHMHAYSLIRNVEIYQRSLTLIPWCFKIPKGPCFLSPWGTNYYTVYLFIIIYASQTFQKDTK